MKPLFIPLNGKFYDAFLGGTKDTEYRLHGPRWNLKTCFPDRPVLLSRGYGKQNRASTAIEAVHVVNKNDLVFSRRCTIDRLYGFTQEANPEIICIKIWNIERIML